MLRTNDTNHLLSPLRCKFPVFLYLLRIRPPRIYWCRFWNKSAHTQLLKSTIFWNVEPCCPMKVHLAFWRALDSGCIAVGPSTDPCYLGVWPCVGSCSDCGVQKTFTGFLLSRSFSQRRRGRRDADSAFRTYGGRPLHLPVISWFRALYGILTRLWRAADICRMSQLLILLSERSNQARSQVKNVPQVLWRQALRFTR
jgi:hypothetical protein